MDKTEQAIETLANAFCRLGKPEHKALYIAAFQSIADIARSEQLLEMRLDFDKCISAGA